MDYDNIKTLLNKYLEGRSSLIEDEILKKYFKKNENIPSEFQYAKTMFSSFSIEKSKQFNTKNINKRRKLFISAISVAASTVIILGMYLYNINLGYNFVEISKKNQTQEVQKIILNDGNIIWLNIGCEISYLDKLKSDLNIISIKGEAFFEFKNLSKYKYKILAHNSIVKIESPSSFNIDASENSTSTNITVASGGIKVLESNCDNSLELLVIEGNYCSVHKSQKLILTSTNKNDNYIAWKTGNLIFNDMPIATIAEVLSKYYNVKIEFKNNEIAYCKFSGLFKKESIEFIINEITTQLNFTVNNTDNIITFSGNKCL